MKQLKSGMIVRVFEDPISCRKIEGRARLIKKHKDMTSFDRSEFWDVQFVADYRGRIVNDDVEPIVMRQINPTTA